MKLSYKILILCIIILCITYFPIDEGNNLISFSSHLITNKLFKLPIVSGKQVKLFDEIVKSTNELHSPISSEISSIRLLLASK